MQLTKTLYLSFTKFVSAQCVRQASSRTANLDVKIFHLYRFMFNTRLVAHQIDAELPVGPDDNVCTHVFAGWHIAARIFELKIRGVVDHLL